MGIFSCDGYLALPFWRAATDPLLRTLQINDLEAPYTAYCDRYCAGFDGWALITRNPRQTAVLAAFSAASPPPASVVSPPESGAPPLWTLDALFLLPKGRLEYYKRLYGRLLHSTPPGRRDYAILAGAVDTLDRLLAAVEARSDILVSAITRRSSWSSVEDSEDTPPSPSPAPVVATPPIELAPPSMPPMDEEEAVADRATQSLLAQVSHDQHTRSERTLLTSGLQYDKEYVTNMQPRSLILTLFMQTQPPCSTSGRPLLRQCTYLPVQGTYLSAQCTHLTLQCTHISLQCRDLALGRPATMACWQRRTYTVYNRNSDS